MTQGFPEPFGALAAAHTWDWAWRELAVVAPAGLRLELLEAWGEPHRHYHDRRHLRECLTLGLCWRDLIERPAEVAIALWFHDAVYDPKRSDNELESAAWAARALGAAGVGSDAIGRVHDLVMATCHGAAAGSTAAGQAGQGGDAGLLLDVDLAILGSSPERFEGYDLDIRKEYAWVPAADYRRRRAAVLQHFLDRPRIYHSDVAFELLEAQARLNLASALKGLRR